MGWRRIEVNGKPFKFKIGNDAAVIRTDDQGYKDTRVVPLSELTGRTPDTIERGRRKKTSDGMITPGHIKEFIEKEY